MGKDAGTEVRSLSELELGSVAIVEHANAVIDEGSNIELDEVPLPKGSRIQVLPSKEGDSEEVRILKIGEREIRTLVGELSVIIVKVIEHGNSDDETNNQELIHAPTKQPVHKCRVTNASPGRCHVRISDGPHEGTKLSVPFELWNGVSTRIGEEDLHVIIVTKDNLKRVTDKSSVPEVWKNSKMGLGALVKKDECK